MVTICPNILSSGRCNDAAKCPYHHQVTICQPCRRMFASATIYNQHIRGAKHKAAALLAPGSGWLYCSVCDAHVATRHDWCIHIAAARHGRKCRQRCLAPDVTPEEPQTVPNHTFCATCNMHVLTGSWPIHIAGRKHSAKERFEAYTLVLEEAEGDKHGVSVSGEFDFGVVEVAQVAAGVNKVAVISTDAPGANVRLVSCILASTKDTVPSSSPFAVSTTGARLTPRMPVSLNIRARQSFAGRAEDRLELLLQDIQSGEQFLIIKVLRIIVGNPTQYQELQPNIPFRPKQRSARHPETVVEPGVKAPSLGAVPYIAKLPMAEIPAELKTTLEAGPESELKRRIRMLHPLIAAEGVYSRLFKHLIWVEEFKASQDMERYDITGTRLRKDNQYYCVDVPGLAENRPSVLVGDSILVRRSEEITGHWYEGCVHVVRQTEVGLRFGRKFSASESDRFTVRFKLNRHPLRRQHQALDQAFAPKRLLFPNSVEGTPTAPSNQTRRKFFNPLIDHNERQKMAVDAIVRAPAGSVPFVIFGPPGTGKTVTMVEAIRQVISNNPNAKILACAPSNSAADLTALRLTELGKTKLFRFYAPSRPKAAVPSALESFTHKVNGHFSTPPAASVAQFTVCVTTCVSASVFFGIGVPRGHFTHIFIDEAGYATEPESMIAVKTMADNRTNVVLSGDPKQLGPIVRSAVAREFGLELSYIERLMKMAMYHGENGNAQCVVKLTQNFRSHLAILKFPNEKFYNNDLVPCAQDVDTFVQSAILPPAGKKFPILFIGMSGKDDREASSPSFFNIEEALMVKEKVDALLGDRKRRLNGADIGIIAPYHAQVQKIRKLLSQSASDIKVGSVEEFQGQERKVIIISTVRSSREFVEYDLRHTLGFVANPRRFNVAVTRAKALLIIIGDPLVLSLDPLWRQFLNYIYQKGGWTGKGISWDPEEAVNEAGGYDVAIREAAEQDMNEFTQQMESLTLAALDDEDVDDDDDQPWDRDDE